MGIVDLLKLFGEYRLGVLYNRPDLAQQVVEFIDKLLAEENRLLPDLTVSGCRYTPRRLLQGSESSILGYVVVTLAKEMGAKDSDEDACLILENQGIIPASWREYTLLFPRWMAPHDPHDQGRFMALKWVGEDLCWKPRQYALTSMFDDTYLVLC